MEAIEITVVFGCVFLSIIHVFVFFFVCVCLASTSSKRSKNHVGSHHYYTYSKILQKLKVNNSQYGYINASKQYLVQKFMVIVAIFNSFPIFFLFILNSLPSALIDSHLKISSKRHVDCNFRNPSFGQN